MARQQTSLLTVARLHTRAPTMTEEIRGGSSTSDNRTKSAISRSPCPMSPATTVTIVHLASSICSLFYETDYGKKIADSLFRIHSSTRLICCVNKQPHNHIQSRNRKQCLNTGSISTYYASGFQLLVNHNCRFKHVIFIQGPRYTSGGPRYTPRGHGTSKSPIPRYA